MSTVYFPKQVADATGLTPAWVRRVAEAHRIGKRYTVGERDRILFSKSDVRKLGEKLGRPVDELLHETVGA